MLSKITRVLCATDGSHSAEKAVDYAVDMAVKLGTGISFVTVNIVAEDELAKEPMYWTSEMEKATDQQVHQALDAAATRAKKAGVKDVKYVVLRGRDIVGSLCKYASKNGYGHIVVGSQGRTGLNRILLGSIAEDVVRHAHCPVTVVR